MTALGTHAGFAEKPQQTIGGGEGLIIPFRYETGSKTQKIVDCYKNGVGTFSAHPIYLFVSPQHQHMRTTQSIESTSAQWMSCFRSHAYSNDSNASKQLLPAHCATHESKQAVDGQSYSNCCHRITCCRSAVSLAGRMAANSALKPL